MIKISTKPTVTKVLYSKNHITGKRKHKNNNTNMSKNDTTLHVKNLSEEIGLEFRFKLKLPYFLSLHFLSDVLVNRNPNTIQKDTIFLGSLEKLL